MVVVMMMIVVVVVVVYVDDGWVGWDCRTPQCHKMRQDAMDVEGIEGMRQIEATEGSTVCGRDVVGGA
jgi:hypothetical protein